MLTFCSMDTGTHVRLAHVGFLEGSDWDEYMEYFEDAWNRVLGRLAEHRS